MTPTPAALTPEEIAQDIMDNELERFAVVRRDIAPTEPADRLIAAYTALRGRIAGEIADARQCRGGA